MIYIFFVGLGLCLLFAPQNALLDETLQVKEVNNESDDDKLNQALILVDILKTEYIKLLRQNIQLRNGYESANEEVEQATCAANATEAPDVTSGTTNHTSDPESSTGGSAPLPAGTPPSQAQPRAPGPELTTRAAMAYYDMPMPQLPYPLHQKLYQRPRRYFRRRIPDYYYYDLPHRRFFNEPPVVGQSQRDKIPPPFYEKPVPKGSDFRRFDYENDPFNDTPTTVLTTTTESTTTKTAAASTTAATTSQSTTRSAQASSDATKVTTTPAPSVETSPAVKTNPTSTRASSKPTINTATVARRPSVRTTASTASPQLYREPLKEKVHRTPSLLTTKDPVDAEVASELVNELKKEGIPLTKLKIKSQPHSTNPITDLFDPAFKTSMRIYLEKSTRYPIPLPENHAFCYTNPNNPLCRTLIK